MDTVQKVESTIKLDTGWELSRMADHIEMGLRTIGQGLTAIAVAIIVASIIMLIAVMILKKWKE